ncbi:High-affinity branched-chain amino acid transport system permease protein LivH [subsurface metagenome]
MIDPIFQNAVVYASLLSLLCVGFTLTYLASRIPNFAHGTMATIGVYISFNAGFIWNVNPYYTLPLAFIFCGLVSLFIYIFVLGALKKVGATRLFMSISMIAVQMILGAFLNIYAEYVRTVLGLISQAFLLRHYDFRLFNIRGIFFFSSILVFSIVTLLYIMLTKTKFGIAMRGTVENPSLATIHGINTELVIKVAWFLTGGPAGVAGALVPFCFQGGTGLGTSFLISIMGGSILGGLSSIYGAVIGGYILGLSEILGTRYLASWFGSWVTSYRILIPLIILSTTLLVAPEGIIGIIETYRMKRSVKKG